MKKNYCFTARKHVDDEWIHRVHIPIADRCGLGCIYCNYINTKNVGDNLVLPGTCEKVILGKDNMVDYLDEKVLHDTGMIGICGPGDPFISIEQLKIFWEVYHEKYSHLKLCMCSSGYNYEKAKKELNMSDIDYLTLTINSLNIDTIKKIYRFQSNFDYNCEKLMSDQANAVHDRLEKKKELKINTVFLPGINDKEIINMAQVLCDKGVAVFNLLNCDTSVEYMKQYDELVEVLIDIYDIPVLENCLKCKSDNCDRF